MHKKGGLFNRETMLIAMGMLVAAVAILGMFNSAKNLLDTEALFKNYLARDIALTMDAVYAAPGELTYSYKINPKHTFYVRLTESIVDVSSERNFEPHETFSYRFAKDSKIEFEFNSKVASLPDKDELMRRPVEIKMTKTITPAKVTVEFVRP